MNHSLRRNILAIGAAIVTLTSGYALPARMIQARQAASPATTRAYPGAAPCNTTLQACINGSSNGDTIHIAAGVYTESFTLDRAVSLIGAGPTLSILTAVPNARVMTVTTTFAPVISRSTVISGLQFTGGNIPGGNGGGAYFTPEATPDLVNVAFLGNTALNGGGLYFEPSSSPATTKAFLVNVIMRANTANNRGGGMRPRINIDCDNCTIESNSSGLSGGGIYAFLDVILKNSSVTSNTANLASGPGELGGGFATNTASIVSSTISGNSVMAGSSGGGFVFSQMTAVDSVVNNNVSTGNGAGLNVNGPASVVNTRLSGNKCTDPGCLGGAAFLNGATTVSGGLVQSNTAAGGGGLYFAAGSLTIDGVQIIGNAAHTGAGVYAQNGANMQMTRNSFGRNVAEAGGGALYLVGGSFTLNNNVFFDNDGGTNAADVGLASASGTVLNGNHNTFSGEHVPGGTAIDIGGDGGDTLALTNTVFSNYGVAITAGSFTSTGQLKGVLYNAVTTALSGAGLSASGVIAGPINFAGASTPAAASDFRLGGLSAAVDSGINSGLVNDHDGASRPQGVGYDLGAYEATPNRRPVANAGIDQSALISTVMTLDGSGSYDPDGQPLQYFWTQIDGTSVALSDRRAVTATFTAPGAPSTLRFVLVVTDTWNVVSQADIVLVDIVITSTEISGLAAVNNSPKPILSVVSFTSTITAGTNVTYVWSFGDGTGLNVGAKTGHVYTVPGTYTAVVTATNNLGVVSASTPVTVTTNDIDDAITGLLATSSGPNNGPKIVGVPVSLVASVDTGNNILYSWAFGDGTTGLGAPATHTYTRAGSYTAVVTATNNSSTATATTLVSVISPVFLPLVKK